MQRCTPIPADLDQTVFDLIIIGAGINGTGIARDAAMRGLRVLLLDQGDITCGTSSRSGRMIHGGLRYLEHGDIGLVWESLRERAILLRIAPHLVHKQPLIIPFYKQNTHRPWKIRLGLTALDLFATLGGTSIGVHRVLSRAQTLERIPGLNPESLTGAAVMQDAYSDHGERLCVENTLAAANHGATVIPHARVERLVISRDTVTGVEFLDTVEDRRHEVQAAMTVNVAGPWVDCLLDIEPKQPRLIGGTKGSFLVVDGFPGAPGDSLFYESISDHRQVVVLPWRGRFLIGTTDIRYDEDPEDAVASDNEIDYLLEETNRAFPGANLGRDSILYTYAGVRPLPYHPEGAEGTITRKHIVHDHAPLLAGLISIVGGKLSTFRSLARETIDLVYKKLGRRSPPCQTHRLKLPGAPASAGGTKLDEITGVSAKSMARILEIYGELGSRVLDIAQEGSDDLKEPFDTTTGAIGAELIMAFRYEFAETLSDVLIRRVMVGYDAIFDGATTEKAARIAGAYLDWTEQRITHEIDSYQHYIQRFQPRHVMQGKGPVH